MWRVNPDRPAISIITATYNRSRALACAIESVRRQTFTDWEMIIVGDACTDDTAEVVSRIGDERIRFVNLERNHGGQAGPNNIGLAEARAPVIAYLSHDDLWLPNHLKSCREAMLAVGADFVLATAANIGSASPLPLRFETMQVNLSGLGPENRYSPAEMDAQVVPASCWLVRREVMTGLAGFPLEGDCVLPPSQVVLFRAWRAGYRIWALNLVTLVIVPSGNRLGSYVRDKEPEQEWFLNQLDNPWLASELAALAPQTNGRWSAGRPPWLLRQLALALARVGVNPRELDFRLRRGFRAGERVAQFRRMGGLPNFGRPEDPGAMLRLDISRQSCRAEMGMTAKFGTGQGGARFLASGWSWPEADGVWSDGETAELLFNFGRRPYSDLIFNFAVRPFTGDGAVARQVEIWAGDKALLDTWVLGPEGTWKYRVRFPLSMMVGSFARICFRFANPASPLSLGLSGDPRQLTIRLLEASVDAAES